MPFIDTKPRATHAEGNGEFRGGNSSLRTPFRPLPPRSRVSAMARFLRTIAARLVRSCDRTLVSAQDAFRSTNTSLLSIHEYLRLVGFRLVLRACAPYRDEEPSVSRRSNSLWWARIFTMTMRAFSSRTADSVPNLWCLCRSPESNPRLVVTPARPKKPRSIAAYFREKLRG